MSDKKEIQNPILKEMDEILKSDENKIEDEFCGPDAVILPRETFKKFRKEVFAKTNYVNTLIQQLQSQNKESSQMAENNHNLLKAIQRVQSNAEELYKRAQLTGVGFNEFRDKVSKLCSGKADFVAVKELHALLGEYPDFTIDETVLVEDVPTKVEVDYE